MSSVTRLFSFTLALLLALATPILGTSVAHAADPELQGRTLLYRKHVDSAHIAWEKDGLHVRVVDGAAVRPVDEVAIRLGPDAAEDGTEVSRLRVGENSPELSFLGKPGTIHWLAPSAYYPGWPPVWAGMGAGKFPDELFTNPDIKERILPESVHLTLNSVDGPGSVEMFNWNSTSGTVGRHFSSTDPKYKSLHMTPGAHGHFNWTFSQAGRYKLNFQAHAKSMGGKLYSSAQTSVLWLVGSDEQVGLPKGTTKAATITKPVDAPVAVPTTKPTKPTQPTGAPTSTPTVAPTLAPTDKPYDPLAFNPTADRTCTHIGKGHLDLSGRFDGTLKSNGWPEDPTLVMAEDSTGKVVDRASYATVMEIGENASFTLGATPGAASLRKYFGEGTKLYSVPEAQDANIPWLGFNTELTDYSKLDHAKFTVTVEGPEGAKMAMGHTDAQGNFVVELDSDRNGQNAPLRYFEKTHTHKAFFFDRPGFYDVGVDYTVVGKTKDTNGDVHQSYGSFTTTFAVGQAAIDHACERARQPKPTTSASPSVKPSATPTAQPTPMPTVTSTSTPTTEPTSSVQPTAAPTVTPTSTPTAPGSAAGQIILDRGHIDAFNVSARGGKLHLALKEDVTGTHVVRAPEDVVLHVKQDAERDIPSTLPGSPRGYFLPMVQDPNLIWPGWDTNGVKDLGAQEVRFTIGVEGPGEAHVFSSDLFGVTSLLAGGGTKLPGTLVAPFPAHTHAAWVFTKPGQYKFTVTAVATKGANKLTSNTATYTWQVGPLPTVAPIKPAPTATPSAPVATPTRSSMPTLPPTRKPTATGAPQQLNPGGDQPHVPGLVPNADGSGNNSLGNGTNGGGGGTQAEKCIPTKVKVPAGEAAAPQGAVQTATSGHFDMGARLDGGNFVFSIKDDRQTPPQWLDPKNLTFGLGSSAQVKAPAGMDFIAAAGTPVHVISSVQQPNVPWIGVNTMHESIVNGTTGTVTLSLDSVEGPGKVAAFMSGTFGGGVGQRLFDNVGGPKSYTIPANTHAHPNWVFTAPGTYKVAMTASATGKDGKKLTASSTVNFAVGDVPAAPQAATVSGGDPKQPAAMVEKTVGRTASGAECNLASTGAGIHPGFIAGAFAFVLLGGVTIAGVLRKR